MYNKISRRLTYYKYVPPLATVLIDNDVRLINDRPIPCVIIGAVNHGQAKISNLIPTAFVSLLCLSLNCTRINNDESNFGRQPNKLELSMYIYVYIFHIGFVKRRARIS